jgi:TRAP-type C4-dicarboxylate transport system permease small subunit
VRPPLLDRLARSLGHGLSWLFLVAVLLTVYEVVLRYAFGAPTVWVHDAVITLSAVCFVFGGALASQQRAHIQVASYSDRASPRVRKALAILCELLTVAYLGMLLYAALKQALPALALMETSGHAWDVPIPAFLKSVLALGVALMLGLAVAHLKRGLTGETDLAKPQSETIV